MRTVDAAQLQAAAPMPELLDAIEAAYRDVAAGRDRSPLRNRVSLPGGDLVLMPGVREDGTGASVKLVTIVPGNAARGLPTIHAVVVWFDAATGEPRALLDGAALTAMRTGAASGVGTRLLARPDARRLAIFGVGAQAAWQVRAVMAARAIDEVRVWSRTAERREAFASQMSVELGAQIRVVAAASAEDAVGGADVICCATTSSEPVFSADWVSPGTHVNGIGSFKHGMVELPPELFARAALVAIDSHEAAMAEAGDVVAAIQAGFVREESLVEIGSVEPGWAAQRDPAAITVFKSVGLAIQDVAAAELVVANLPAPLPGG